MPSSQYTFRLSGYRCFGHDHPAKFSIGDGMTAFVGRNNCGKSALLRFFHDFREVIRALSMRPAQNGFPMRIGLGSEIRDPGEVFCKHDDQDLSIQVELPPGHSELLRRPTQCVEALLQRPDARFTVLRINGFDSKPFDSQPQDGHVIKSSAGEPLCDYPPYSKAILALGNACYVPAYRYVSEAAGSNLYDILNGEAFVTEWNGALNGDSNAMRERVRRVEVDVARLMRFKEFRTSKSAHGSRLIIQIDNKSYPLADVGSGVTQLLLLLGTVALTKPSFLFIDEPELNLHPSLQLDLLTTLASYVDGNLVFATHNIGLARAAATRIYVVEQDRGGMSTVNLLEDHPTLAQLLGELQYGAYSQVGGRRVLLVEGPGDALVFQQFLRKFGADHSVIVLTLGGRTLINAKSTLHLEEVKRICPTVAAIIDSEKDSESAVLEPARSAFKANCDSLGFACHITERRATDNYLTQESLRKAFGDSVTALGAHDKFKASTDWQKANNWRAAQLMTKSDLLATDIGQFLDRWLSIPIA